MEKAPLSRLDWRRFVLRVLGSGLLFASGAIHLDLYVTGYRSIPTIGELFLFQIVATFILGLIVLGFGAELASAAGAGFVLATLGGYLLSLRFSLFGFREVRTSAGIVAGVIEVSTFTVLSAFTFTRRTRRAPGRPVTLAGELLDRLQSGIPRARLAVAACSVLAFGLLGISEASTAATSTRSSLLKTARIGAVTVITDDRGYTLYWFALDTPAKSNCTGTCVAYWPPLTGSLTASRGVTGALGTVTRGHGVAQVTYDGHPLYRYIGDSAPGQATGNGLDLNGGMWHEMAASG